MGGSSTFTSQFGTVNLSTLPVISRDGVPQPPIAAPAQDSSAGSSYKVSQPPVGQPASPSSNEDTFATLDRLGALKEKGYITDEEFASKKAELLSRL